MSYLKGMIEEMQELETKKKKKKNIIISILAILILMAAGFFGYRIYADYKEEQFLKG